MARRPRRADWLQDDLDGYVWYGSNTPFVDGGTFIGFQPGTLGHAIKIDPLAICALVESYRIAQPETGWYELLLAAGLPPGGLAAGTPAAVVWSILSDAGLRQTGTIRSCMLALEDYSGLVVAVRGLALPVHPAAEVQTFPDDVIARYRISS